MTPESANRPYRRRTVDAIERACRHKGLRMTGQRRVIARVLGEAEDHPDVVELHRRAATVDDRISLSTVYRTLKLFETEGIIERLEFRGGRSRYERASPHHHDHLINLATGEVIEFRSEEIEALQTEIARRLGYELVDHRLELYAVPLEPGRSRREAGPRRDGAMTQFGIAWRLAVMTLVFAALAPVQAVILRADLPGAGRLPVWFHRVFVKLFGIRVRVRGRPPGGHPTLVLSNHVSWLDIAVIGSVAPVSFIAKTEVAGWPVFGLFAKLQRSVFIDRARRSHAVEVNTTVARRLVRGDLIVLFAEGTTGDGNRVLPFRSSLVGAARAALADEDLERIHLQPLGLAYVRRNGMPVTRRERPAIAWYGDMELAPHLAAFVREGPLDVEVTWGEPIPFEGSSDRKRATAQAEAGVRLAVKGPAGLAPTPASQPRQTAFPILSQARSA